MSNYFRGLLFAFFAVIFYENAQAGIIIEISESGSDVLMTTTGGILDVSGLTFGVTAQEVGVLDYNNLIVGQGGSGLYTGTFTSFEFASNTFF